MSIADRMRKIQEATRKAEKAKIIKWGLALVGILVAIIIFVTV